MACPVYEGMKPAFFEALKAEDEAHFDHRRIPEKQRIAQFDRTRAAVESMVMKSRWHVQECERCKADGNEPLVRPPL